MANLYLGNVHYINAKASVDTLTTVTEAFTSPIDIGECTELHFAINFGAITGDTVVVKAYKDVNTTTGDGTAISFMYKLTSAVGTDSISAWTAASTSGVTIAATDDNKVLVVSIDPAACSGYPYVYLGIDPGASMTSCVYGVTAIAVPRQNRSTPSSMQD